MDAIGLMADFIETRGGKIIGFTSTKGYEFDSHTYWHLVFHDSAKQCVTV